MSPASTLTVPRRHVPILTDWAQLEEGAATRLQELLEAEGSTHTRADFLSRFESVPELTGLDADVLLRALSSLLNLHQSHEWDIDDITTGVSRSSDLDLAPDLREALRGRLAAAMSARPIAMLAKAADLTYEHDRVFHTARVLTDIRPLFDDDAKDGMLGALVVHTLRIEYFGSGGHTETVEVAMSDAQLNRLARAIDRAQAKAETVQGFLAKAGLESIAPDEEE